MRPGRFHDLRARCRIDRGVVGPCLRALVFACAIGATASAQTIEQRGLIEPRLFLFPQDAPNDPTDVVVDLLARDEVFVKPSAWLRFAGGVDLRADSHGRVEDDFDFRDRTVRRPRFAVRRLAATVARGWLTIDIGKQFVRWGKTDIVNPTDHLAPRDFLDVVDNDFLGVTGVRAVAGVRGDSLDAIWVPWFTPSRVPLLDQRWTAVPTAAAGIPIVDATQDYPGGSQVGVRWNHPGEAIEYSLSFFDGYNNLPNIDAAIVPAAAAAGPTLTPSLSGLGLGPPVQLAIRRVYPAIRSYGGDVAVPTRWLTLKGEAAYTTSSTPGTDDYALYVIQIERQAGEWTFVGGYIGETVTERRAALTFAPDRGLAHSIAGRAAYTIDANRSVTFETAAKQDGRGIWLKGEYSQARGEHWRITATAAAIAGHSDDFLGQYRRNSHVLLATRYSF